MVRVGINGLGRIGRKVFRNLLEREDVELVAVNDIMPIETMAYLLKYDSVHGKLDYQIRIEDDSLLVGNKKVKILACSEPKDIPWNKLLVDIVVESSGLFKYYHQLKQHIEAGAKKVILSCPPGDKVDKLVVYGINHQIITSSDFIISNASCTTNCLAPIIYILEKEYGFDKAFMNTVHPFTNNQQVLDAPHSDIRRGRALGVNMIPTTSTAVNAVIQIFPELKGRFDGMATRVPLKVGSIIELNAILNTKATVDSLNKVFEKYSANELKGILEYTEDPIVSSDIIGNSHSAIFDALSTKVLGDNFVQLIIWYDNEYGYSSRICDLVSYLSQFET